MNSSTWTRSESQRKGKSSGMATAGSVGALERLELKVDRLTDMMGELNTRQRKLERRQARMDAYMSQTIDEYPPIPEDELFVDEEVEAPEEGESSAEDSEE